MRAIETLTGRLDSEPDNPTAKPAGRSKVALDKLIEKLAKKSCKGAKAKKQKGRTLSNAPAVPTSPLTRKRRRRKR